MTQSASNVLFLVANGFEQAHFIAVQRACLQQGLKMTLVSPEKSLVNGFNGQDWGLTFPVEAQIDSVLGSDFDSAVVIGGEKSIKRLQENPHTARILEAFSDMQKPVVLLNEAQVFAGTLNALNVDGEITDENVSDIVAHLSSSPVVLAQAA